MWFVTVSGTTLDLYSVLLVSKNSNFDIKYELFKFVSDNYQLVHSLTCHTVTWEKQGFLIVTHLSSIFFMINTLKMINTIKMIITSSMFLTIRFLIPFFN